MSKYSINQIILAHHERRRIRDIICI